jgi:hypothetical protein
MQDGREETGRETLIYSNFNLPLSISLGSLGDDGSETDTDTEGVGAPGLTGGGGRHNIWNVTHTIWYRLVPATTISIPVSACTSGTSHVTLGGHAAVIDASQVVHAAPGTLSHPLAGEIPAGAAPLTAATNAGLIPVVAMAPNMGGVGPGHPLALAPHNLTASPPLAPLIPSAVGGSPLGDS